MLNVDVLERSSKRLRLGGVLAVATLAIVSCRGEWLREQKLVIITTAFLSSLLTLSARRP